MEHWSPSEARTDETPGPRDAWVAWLMHSPVNEVQPDGPRTRDWTGAVMIAGVVVFWTATATAAWRAFA